MEIDDVLEFMASDEVEYHTGHLKKQVLKPMEIEGQIEVDESSRNRKKTYPSGSRIRFI